jgi:hypothetical protein
MDILHGQSSMALCLQENLRTTSAVHLAGKVPIHGIAALKRVKCQNDVYHIELCTLA